MGEGLGPRFVSATAGAEGCIAYDGERYYRQLAKPVTDMKDTMGAGDSFLTSFLMCYLDSAKRGEDGAEAIERALDFAAGFASTVCGMEGPGAMECRFPNRSSPGESNCRLPGLHGQKC